MGQGTKNLMDFTALMAQMAEYNRLRMLAMETGEERLQFVTSQVAKAEVAIGVWNDPGEPGGVNLLVIKGSDVLAELTKNRMMAVAAIPCENWEQAEAARQYFAPTQN
jgi:hypothetical protein